MLSGSFFSLCAVGFLKFTHRQNYSHGALPSKDGLADIRYFVVRQAI
jgi:hypothetical protein